MNILFLYIGNEWNRENYNNEKYIYNLMFSFCVLQLHYIYIKQINQENFLFITRTFYLDRSRRSD